MRLRSLRLQNFRQHIDTQITFDLGLTGIIGPNGAGKSTILEAIAWALYGNTMARGTRESIRFHGAPPRASVRVELEFELGPHLYRVVRGLTSAELFVDGGSSPIANSIGAVGQVLEQKLGMTAREFHTTYFTRQKDLAAMAAMGPTDRGKFLSRVLGYDRLQKAQDLARERRSAISAELRGLTQSLADAEELGAEIATAEAAVHAAEAALATTAAALQAMEARVREAEPRWKAMELARTKDIELQAAIIRTEGQVDAATRDAERAAAAVTDAERVVGGLTSVLAELAPLAAMRVELQSLEEGSRQAARRQALSEEVTRLTATLDAATARLAQLAPAPTLRQEVADALAVARDAAKAAQANEEARRTDWVRDRQEAETRRSQLRDQFRDVKHQRDTLEKLGPDAPCPTCTRPLGENYVALLEDFDGKLESLRLDGVYFAQRLEQLAPEPDDLRALAAAHAEQEAAVKTLERRELKIEQALKEQAEKEQEVRQLTALRDERVRAVAALSAQYDATRHEIVRASVATLGALEVRHAAEKAIADDLPARRTRATAATQALAAARDSLQAAQTARRTHGFSQEQHAAAMQAWRTAEQERSAAHGSRVGAERDAAAAAAALARARMAAEQAARVRATQRQLELDRRVHDELDAAFGELRTELNARLRPELGEIAGSFLTDLTDDRYNEFELDENYEIILIGSGVPRQVISGGEEDLANLVLRLAVSQLIAERSGQPFSLLVLDEVFGSLDEHRRANVVELLRRLQDRFEQVIVITHIDGVRDGLDRVLEVSIDEPTGRAVVMQREGLPVPDDSQGLLEA